MALSPEQRALNGWIGAFVVHSRHDSRQITAPARAAADARFEREVVEAARAKGEELTSDELVRRTQMARRAYFARLSAKARAARSVAGKAAAG